MKMKNKVRSVEEQLATYADFMCEMCGAIFKKRGTLINHMYVHTRESKHTCPHCGKTCRDINSLKGHIATHNNLKPYQCSDCGKAYTVKSSLKQHKLIHRDEKRFSCHYCKRGFNKKSNLQRHLRKHYNEKPYQCKLCLERFSIKSHFDTHIAIHTDPNRFGCQHCDSKFSQAIALKKHQEKHHVFNCSGTRSDTHTFDEQNKKAESSSTLSRQVLKRHSVPKKLKCFSCEKTFTRKSSLTIHCQLHSQKRQYQCEICDKIYYQQSSLNVHLRTHFNETHPNYSKKLSSHIKVVGVTKEVDNERLFSYNGSEIQVFSSTSNTVSTVEIESPLASPSAKQERTASLQNPPRERNLQNDHAHSGEGRVISDFGQEITEVSTFSERDITDSGHNTQELDGHDKDLIIDPTFSNGLSIKTDIHTGSQKSNETCIEIQRHELHSSASNSRFETKINSSCTEEENKTTPTKYIMLSADKGKYVAVNMPKLVNVLLKNGSKDVNITNTAVVASNNNIGVSKLSQELTQKEFKRQRVSLQIKPHTCSLCKKVFRTNWLLKVHLQTHTDVKPFACDMCNKNFRQKSHLKKHLQVHGKGALLCVFCDKCDFLSKQSLKEHIVKHFENKDPCISIDNFIN